MLRKILQIWAGILIVCVVGATLLMIGYGLYSLVKEELWILFFLIVFIVGGLISGFLLQEDIV